MKNSYFKARHINIANNIYFPGTVHHKKIMLDEWWWCTDRSLQSIAESLLSTYVAVVDNFLPVNELNSVRTEVQMHRGLGFMKFYFLHYVYVVSNLSISQVHSAHKRGLLSQHGLTGGSQSGSIESEVVQDDSIRGDVFGFFESTQNTATQWVGEREKISLEHWIRWWESKYF